MAFRNPVFAGTYLVRTAMQSPGFVHNASGWSINRDGSAEFNNITIRGATTAQGVSLWYNGTPAAGNLIASIAAAAGTDPFGNAYPQGLATYNGSGTRTGLWNLGQLVCTDPTSGGFAEIIPTGSVAYSPTLAFAAGGTSSSKAAAINVQTDTTDTNQPLEILTMAGPASTADAHHSYPAVQLYAGGTTTDGAKGYLAWFNNSVGYVPFVWNESGIAAIGTVYGAHPGTLPAAQETWQTTSLAAGWTQHAGAQCRYRMMPDGTVAMQGFMDFAGTLTSGATITGTALPTAYRPLQTYLVPVCLSGNVFGQLQVNPTGTAQIFYPGASLVNPTLVWDPVRFPVI